MAQVTAPVRSIGQRLRSLAGIAVSSALVLFWGDRAVDASNEIRQADRRYSRRRPRRPIDSTRAGDLTIFWQLEKVADSENSVLKVREIAGKLPGGWPGIKHYDRSFSVEGETPEVGLSQSGSSSSRPVLRRRRRGCRGPSSLGLPTRPLDGVRPKAERLEQVGELERLRRREFSVR